MESLDNTGVEVCGKLATLKALLEIWRSSKQKVFGRMLQRLLSLSTGTAFFVLHQDVGYLGQIHHGTEIPMVTVCAMRNSF